MEQLYGREVIYSDLDEITEENVLEMLAQARAKHAANRSRIEWLDKYCRGKQPVLERQKEVRPEIKSTIVENHSYEIVSFKTGYLVGEPIQYVSRTGDEDLSDDLSALNSYMLYEEKAAKDKDLVDWQHICGTAYRMALPHKAADDEESPFNLYTLEPAQTFVVYSSGVGHAPLAGVYYTTDTKGTDTYHVYTPYELFTIKEGSILSAEPHGLRMIPIIEYPANRMRLGAFEPVVPLLDAINSLNSNRMDGVESFIQSLAIAVNCNFPEGTTANDIRQAGMIVLKSVGENRADFKILSEQLNQTETQTYKEDLYQSVLQIVGMPILGSGKTSDSSNNGAVILRNGWQAAEARAKDSELMFKQSEKELLKLVLHILRGKTDVHLKVTDVECKFTRRCYEDIYTKTNVLVSMLNNDKIAPQLAFSTSGLFSDPEEAYRVSMEWYEKVKEEELETEAAQNAPQMGEVPGAEDANDSPLNEGNDGKSEGSESAGLRATGGRWSRKPRQVMCVETGQTYATGIEAERANGIARGKVSVACRNGGKAGGYHWKYVDGTDNAKKK